MNEIEVTDSKGFGGTAQCPGVGLKGLRINWGNRHPPNSNGWPISRCFPEIAPPWPIRPASYAGKKRKRRLQYSKRMAVYSMEQTCSQKETAHKVFGLLLQITLTICNWWQKSVIQSGFLQTGSHPLKNIATRELEAWRKARLDDQAFLILFEASPSPNTRPGFSIG